MYANEPAMARRWEKESKKGERDVPSRKNSAKMPIGRGKAGSGKRLISEAGGGKKALKTWRSMTKSARSRIKASAASAPGRYDILQTMRNVRGKPATRSPKAVKWERGAKAVAERSRKPLAPKTSKPRRVKGGTKTPTTTQLARKRMNQGNMRSSNMGAIFSQMREAAGVPKASPSRRGGR